MTIRRALEADAPALARIAARSDHQAWDETRFAYELSMPQTRALAAEIGGAIAGFAIGWQVEGELELHLIAVDPVARRSGLGAALLAAFEGEAPVVHLEVSEHNRAALALYRASGYVEVGRRADYYARGDAALLMRHIRR